MKGDGGGGGGGGGGWEMPSISIQKASDTSWGKNAVFSVFSVPDTCFASHDDSTSPILQNIYVYIK